MSDIPLNWNFRHITNSVFYKYKNMVWDKSVKHTSKTTSKQDVLWRW